jgi:hypothetical protein
MTIERVSRLIAFAIAGAAMLDPALSLHRTKLVDVEIISSDANEAARVRDRLTRDLEGHISVVRRGRGEAVVCIDDNLDSGSIRDGVPASFVTLRTAPNVRLVHASSTGVLFPGERGVITVDVVVSDLAGTRSRFTVDQDGIEIGALDHVWTAAGQSQISVPFMTLASGSHRVQIVATPVPEEQQREDNTLDVNVTTSDRRAAVAFIERRPSWSSRFVRQAIESDPRLQVASMTRASIGVDIRVGDPPALLTRSAATQSDVLVIGGPEELRTAEVARLRAFMAERGGTVVLLPDRKPSGPFTALVPSSGFDEVLFASPVGVTLAGAQKGPSASEFALLRRPAPSMRTLATLPDGRPVVASWPIGAGTLIVSGALDAWRYRASGEDEFAKFWRSLIAAAARRAPPALVLDLDPPIGRPGAPVRVTARMRQTEFLHERDAIRFPSISALAQVDGGNGSEFIRLWPTTELGVFQGEFVPAEPRKYTVHVSTGNADAAAVFLPGEREPAGVDEREAAIISAATGGVVTASDRLTPIVDHLRSRARDHIAATVYPMRTPWLILAFTIVLGTEWTLRRRRGER